MPHKTKTKTKTATAMEGNTKKKLRTSLDVYHRLLHDTTLAIDTQNIQIGYTDGKYTEVQHMLLHDWVMIDKGGDIPMHHIIYFKYGNIIIWDRRIRLDRLYGSGNTKPAQLLKNILANNDNINIQAPTESAVNDYDDDEHKIATPGDALDYPLIGKFVANPRTEKVIENKLSQKGIKKISYVYSFGMIGYTMETTSVDDDSLTPRYIAIQHRKNQHWGFPKGRYENGEGKYGYYTACREFEEETGIAVNTSNVAEVDWMNPYMSHYQYKWKDTLIKKWTVLFAAKLASHVQPKIIRPKEIAEVRFMTLQQFLQRNKHKENEQILRKLNNKLMSHPNNINIDQESKSEPEQKAHNETCSTNSVATTLVAPKKTVRVKDIIGDVDALINCLSTFQ